MTFIQSRKHAVARQPRHRCSMALAAAALALPGAVLAQSAAPAAPAAAASQPRGDTMLPTNLRGFDSSQSIFVDGIRDLGAVSREPSCPAAPCART